MTKIWETHTGLSRGSCKTRALTYVSVSSHTILLAPITLVLLLSQISVPPLGLRTLCMLLPLPEKHSYHSYRNTFLSIMPTQLSYLRELAFSKINLALILKYPTVKCSQIILHSFLIHIVIYICVIMSISLFLLNSALQGQGPCFCPPCYTIVPNTLHSKVGSQ